MNQRQLFQVTEITVISRGVGTMKCGVMLMSGNKQNEGSASAKIQNC
jgi:hypothetical protein